MEDGVLHYPLPYFLPISLIPSPPNHITFGLNICLVLHYYDSINVFHSKAIYYFIIKFPFLYNLLSPLIA